MSHNMSSTKGYFRVLRRRGQTAALVSTCGFKDGDSNQPRTADPGFDCRVDTQHAIWGFCPTTVIIATDCGLAGNCVDSHGCSSGCGIKGTPGITTFTCTSQGADFCSTALLTAGPDQTYSYLACAKAPETVHLLAAATTTSSTSVATSSSSSSQTAAPVTSLATSSASTTSSPASGSSALQSFPSSSASASSPTNATTTSSPSSSSLGAIVGGVIGGLALVAFVVLAVMFLRRYRRDSLGAIPEHAPLANSTLAPWRDERDTHYAANSKYAYAQQLDPVELSTQRANSPYELHS